MRAWWLVLLMACSGGKSDDGPATDDPTTNATGDSGGLWGHLVETVLPRFALNERFGTLDRFRLAAGHGPDRHADRQGDAAPDQGGGG